MIKQYLQVMKPGIVLSNLISVIGGFLLASRGQIDYILFFSVLFGMSLVVASSCIFNNYIDRDIDQKMERTKNRVLANGMMSPKFSLIYSIVVGIIGFILLYLMANLLVVWLAWIGFIIYVGLYSLYIKRNSIYSTSIGSLSGAMPPVIGYCAVSNQFDTGALILLLIFSLWQIPHFYSIAIFYFKDYQIASIPILPVKYGISVTKHYITICIIGFTAATIMLSLSGYTGYKYLIVAILVSVWWLIIALHGYKPGNNDKIWARKLFVSSIVAITLLSIIMSVDFV